MIRNGEGFPLADALASAESMLIYADWLQDRGRPDCWQWRAASAMRSQAAELCGLELFPTGSRLYGARYVRPISDWDFFALMPDDPGEAAGIELRLLKFGWQSHTQRGASASAPDGSKLVLSQMNVQLILLFDRPAFDAVANATAFCVTFQPATRAVAIGAFKAASSQWIGGRPNDDEKIGRDSYLAEMGE